MNWIVYFIIGIILYSLMHFIRGLLNIEFDDEHHMLGAICAILWPLSILIALIVLIFIVVSYLFEYLGSYLRRKFYGK